MAPKSLYPKEMTWSCLGSSVSGCIPLLEHGHGCEDVARGLDSSGLE
jgi:hypothetical protein